MLMLINTRASVSSYLLLAASRFSLLLKPQFYSLLVSFSIQLLNYLCCVQQVIAFLVRPEKESKVRKYWNWYHYGLGRGLIILAVANVFHGIHLGDAGSGWKAGYAAVVCVLFVVAFILELRLWITD